MLEQLVDITCPYCSAAQQLAVDLTAGSARYVEDCRVCCRPMDVVVDIDAEGTARVRVARDDA